MATLRIDIITMFPEMFASVLDCSIIKRAQEHGVVEIQLHHLRDYAHDKRRTVDDRPYGGGPGMILRPEPLYEAVEAVERARHGHTALSSLRCQRILMTPSGQPLTQSTAQALSQESHVIILCGHYEGVDEHIRELVVTRELSIGDYVVTGGELPAMVLVDAVVRLVPGAVGDAQSTRDESFSAGLLEYPHYTRPPVFQGVEVPSILRSGHHEAIATWRRLQSLAKTWGSRPDLIGTTSPRVSQEPQAPRTQRISP